MHEWGFATRREALADLGSDHDQWAYAYAKPSGMLKALAVLPPDTEDTETQPYIIETNAAGADVIYTNQETAVLRFIVRITDPTRFSPLFVEALSWLLASKLAGPVLKGETGAAAAKSALQMFGAQFRLATVSDANQQHKRPEQQAAWIAGR
jgi:hypothetical protein